MPHDDHTHAHGHGQGHAHGHGQGHDHAHGHDHGRDHDHDHHHDHDHDHDHGHDHGHDHAHGHHHHHHAHEPAVTANLGEEVVWERWQKKRTFVRALEGTYGELVRELFNQPRVYHSKDWKWKGGPHNYGKKIINPQAVKVAQSIECHLDLYAPNGVGQKHGHMNSAVFYVLKGKGHDVHDGRRLDWEAGDALVVENGCVHQHCSDTADDECLVLIMKAKPLFLFMHLMFQKVVQYPSMEPGPGQELYTLPTEI